MLSLAKLKECPFDVIVVWSTSRFGRDQDEAMFNKIYLKKYGIEVKFVSQNIPDGHIGKLIERIYEWKDEADSIMIGQNAFEGLREVTQKGFHGGGKAPHGYRREKVVDPDGKLDKEGTPVYYVTYEVVPEQAALVRRVFEEYSDGASYKKVAHALNCEGVVSPGGKTWDTSAVRTILHNESYRGYRVWNQTRRNKKVQKGTKTSKPREEWVIQKGTHEPIIEEALWEAVEARRAQNRKHIENGKGGYNTGHAAYMLSGLLKCDECGANFSITGAKSRGGARYYRCGYNSNRGNSVCGNNRLVRQDKIEAEAFRVLSEDLLRVDVIEDVVEEYRITMKEMQGSTDTQDLDKAIRKVVREIGNLTASLKALGPTQELVDEMTACQEQKAALESERRSRKAAMPSEIAEIDSKGVAKAIEDLLGTLELATPEEKKKLMQANVAEVLIPQQEEPLLVSNPEGLLTSLGCFFRLVTPTRVQHKTTSKGRIRHLDV